MKDKTEGSFGSPELRHKSWNSFDNSVVHAFGFTGIRHRNSFDNSSQLTSSVIQIRARDPSFSNSTRPLPLLDARLLPPRAPSPTTTSPPRFVATAVVSPRVESHIASQLSGDSSPPASSPTPWLIPTDLEFLTPPGRERVASDEPPSTSSHKSPAGKYPSPDGRAHV